MVLRETKRSYRAELIITMYSFECYFSRFEHIAHYKAKNQTQSKTNFRSRARANCFWGKRQHAINACMQDNDWLILPDVPASTYGQLGTSNQG